MSIVNDLQQFSVSKATHFNRNGKSVLSAPKALNQCIKNQKRV